MATRWRLFSGAERGTWHPGLSQSLSPPSSPSLLAHPMREPDRDPPGRADVRLHPGYVTQQDQDTV